MKKSFGDLADRHFVLVLLTKNWKHKGKHKIRALILLIS
jgi:hypothetical protein